MNAGQLVESGHRLSQLHRFPEAETCFRRAIELNPSIAIAHSNLGWTRHMQGDPDAAVSCYREAMRLDPDLRIARRSLASLLVRLGRIEESRPLWQAELHAGRDGLLWMQNLVTDAMAARDLALAGTYAALFAELRWGGDGETASAASATPAVPLSIPKLRHDIGQLRYLEDHGMLGEDVTPMIDEYRRVLAHIEPMGPDARLPLNSERVDPIRRVYNRLLHVRDTPRVERALSGLWDPAEVERRYVGAPPGVVYVDDFLSAKALEGVRRFCLESTIWSGNRYALGRIGAFFQDGFNCPLLLQIAEELRDALPRIIGDRYTLRQLWGFKSGPELPADATTHADFAAVNVNFWITPDEANLDPNTGGLIVYDVDAPLHWDFQTYNGRSDIIEPFLKRQGSRAVTIPYRQNRAIIFNSDLFHGTDAVTFAPGYENLRVNITMLYGDRQDEVHHRQLARPDPTDPVRPAWRSEAFVRARRRR